MEFDKSKVYTALNADELKIGSKVYLADDLADLRHIVETDYKAMILSSINPENHQCRFCEGITGYALAYLVEETEGLKWTDLKVGDVIRLSLVDCGRECMITEIDRQDTEAFHIRDGTGAFHIRAGTGWLTDEELKDWEKVEND